ncbi:MAG: hypothetical protein CL878_15755 [Dehalococcoidia bacterium]|nr:hypothetical protein [Dehalococcoidia bacterium]
MKYACLIYDEEAKMATATEQDIGMVMDAYMKYEAEVQGAGVKAGGEALQPTTTATVVQVKDGQTVTTDGPFAETKEQLGGFYLIEAKDLDEAIAWAAKIPSASMGGKIEVRPIQEFENQG